MDHVLAKVKGIRKKPFYKLISNYTLFEAIAFDVAGCVEYTPDHNLDEDAWFKIEKFSRQPFSIDLVKNNFDSKDYDDITKDKFVKISYLFSVQDKNFYFQKITPSLFIRRKTVVFGDVAQVEECDNRLVVNSQPDAVYLKDFDVLIFKSLATISSIFPGIDELYKEATKEEVEQFLDVSFVEPSNSYDVNRVSKPNRKRIALAMATLEDLSPSDKANMLTYIHGYCQEKLKYDKDNERFEISTDHDLKLLLYGIEQRFYTTPFGQERRLANSVQSFD
jgi:hypothetical protein